jgi:site-specific recombinase XerD
MKTGGTLPKVYSQQQVQKLISAVGNAKHQLVLILAYGCGLRLEEIRTLNYTDFDFDKSLLRLKQGKDSKDRVIMLDPVIQQCVENYCISTKIKGNIFTNDSSGELLSRRTLSKIFDNACIKAGVIKLGGIHTLRLCFATHLLEQGTDLRYIQKLLGHSSSKTTEIYTHVSAKSISKIRSPIAQLDVVQKKI